MLQNKVLGVADLTEGMIVAQGLIDERGQFWLSAGTTLTDYLIDRLRLLGIGSIRVVDPAAEEPKPVQMEPDFVAETLPEVAQQAPEEVVIRSASNLSFKEQYMAVLEDVRKLIGFAAAMRDLSQKRIEQTVDGVMNLVAAGFSQVNYLAMMPRSQEYLVHHSLHVALYAGLIGSATEPFVGQAALRRLVMAGLLHDLGKLVISQELLQKPGQLTAEEMALVQQHAALGYKWLRKINGIHPETLLAVLQHHERLDGTGYPLQLSGTDRIHSFSRILAIADTFDAMTSKRVHKGRISILAVIRLLQQESFSRLDLKYCRILLDNLVQYLVGDDVQLSDGRCGRLVYWASAEDYPVVLVADEALDLSRRRDLYISHIVGA